MKDDRKAWDSDKVWCKKTALALLGIICSVKDVPKASDEIGYTSATKEIFVAFDHKIMEGLKTPHRRVFRLGVFAHELLHQVFTDFVTFEKMQRRCEPAHRKIFALLANVLEDPAIENFAHQVMGGTLLKSLGFTIRHIYKDSPPLEESKTAFSQFVNALIQFGDMGLLKGSFTFPEAKTTFAKVAPLFAKGVEEPNCKQRFQIAKQIMDISAPLWEEELKNQDELNKLLDALAKQGKSAMNGNGKGQDADADGETSTASKRRKITIEKVSKEEFEEMKKNSEATSGELPDGDITVVTCDESTDSETETNGNSAIDVSNADISTENINGDETNQSDQKSAPNAEEKSNGANSQKSEPKDNSESNSKEDSKGCQDGKNNPFVAPRNSAEQKVNNIPTPEDYEADDSLKEISEDEYTISNEDMERIQKEMDTAQKNLESEVQKESRTVPIDDFNVTSAKLGTRSCLNYRVTYNESDKTYLQDEYSRIVSEHARGIHSLATQLRRIFNEDREEKNYRTSGKINVARMNCGRVTTRIFDRKSDPVGKSDICVELLVDESGSMASRNKATSARTACIALAEVFDRLNIPVYIIGFTADTQGYDVVHNHYVTWKNTHAERLKLMNITARANNCDGYSIRYATQVLKKHKSKNKLLIVISDGQPAASRYYDGVADTKAAIREARKYHAILGVAIGNSDTETIHSMYENDFLSITDIDGLFAGLSNKIKKLVKHWGE